MYSILSLYGGKGKKMLDVGASRSPFSPFLIYNRDININGFDIGCWAHKIVDFDKKDWVSFEGDVEAWRKNVNQYYVLHGYMVDGYTPKDMYDVIYTISALEHDPNPTKSMKKIVTCAPNSCHTIDYRHPAVCGKDKEKEFANIVKFLKFVGFENPEEKFGEKRCSIALILEHKN